MPKSSSERRQWDGDRGWPRSSTPLSPRHRGKSRNNGGPVCKEGLETKGDQDAAGKGNGRIKGRHGRGRRRSESFPRDSSFLATVPAFSSSSCRWCSSFFSSRPISTHLTRVLSARTLFDLLWPCVTSIHEEYYRTPLQNEVIGPPAESRLERNVSN